MALPYPADQLETDKFLLDSANLPSIRFNNSPPLDILYDTTDAAPNYIGLNFKTYNASQSTTDWVVLKITYSGSDITRIQRRDAIAWTARATSF